MRPQAVGAVRERMESGIFEDANREELLREVGSLRDELTAMATDIRSVIGENAELKRELKALRNYRGEGQPASEIHRAKDEIDNLIRLHEAVSGGRPAPQQALRQEQSHANGAGDRSAWMKKMMMFMMMTELI